MPNTAIQRTECSILTNKSGGSVAQGDVVIVDTANADSFTTTTSAAYVDGQIGVVLEPNGIANNASGLIAFTGWVPVINLSGTGSIGDMVATHTVAKQGARHAAPQAGGDFAQVFGTSATPKARLFGTVQLSGGSGAPTTSEYVTTASDGGLSAEVVIPGLAGSPDIAGAGGAGTSEEYDSNTDPFTWSAAPAVYDADTTIKSHYYIKNTDSTDKFGSKAWAPVGAFDARMKLSVGKESGSGSSGWFGLAISDSGDTAGLLLVMIVSQVIQGGKVQAFTRESSSYIQRGSDWSLGNISEIYLRITRDGSNNCSFYLSMDGKTWRWIATQALTFTVAKIGIKVGSASGDTITCASDWLRTSV